MNTGGLGAFPGIEIQFVVNSQVGWRQKRGTVQRTSKEFAEAKSRTTFHNAAIALVRLYWEIVSDFRMG